MHKQYMLLKLRKPVFKYHFAFLKDLNLPISIKISVIIWKLFINWSKQIKPQCSHILNVNTFMFDLS